MKCPFEDCGKKGEVFMIDDRPLTTILSIGDLMTQGTFYTCRDDEEGSHIWAVFMSPIYLEADE